MENGLDRTLKLTNISAEDSLEESHVPMTDRLKETCRGTWVDHSSESGQTSISSSDLKHGKVAEVRQRAIQQTALDNGSVTTTELKFQIVWKNVGIFTGLHMAAIIGIFMIPRSHPLTWLWSLILYIMSAIGVTAGAHRLWSHRSYKARLPLRVLLAVMNSTALQNSIFDWVRDHRVHHKFSETNADPHNAKNGFFFSHIGWLLVRKHPDVIRKGKQISLNDIVEDKVVMFQHRYYRLAALLMCVLVPTLLPWYCWGESFMNSLFIPCILRYALVLNATWLVNSAAHLWGNKPYDKTINPSENKTVVLAAVGEGYHNYHHTFPQDYATGELGRYLNLTTAFIDICAFLGLAYGRKTIPRDIVMKRKERTGDGS